MENNKLIPMTEFIKQLGETSTLDTEEYDWAMAEIDKLNTIRRYANFLSQPLAIEMFVACDEEGNVISEPLLENNRDAEGDATANWPWEYKEWCDAKERVLFEGFKLEQWEEEGYKYICINNHCVYPEELGSYNVEWLCRCSPTLTPTALKMIYGRDI